MRDASGSPVIFLKAKILSSEKILRVAALKTERVSGARVPLCNIRLECYAVVILADFRILPIISDLGGCGKRGTEQVGYAQR